jgi:hypothetical protein
VSTPFEELTDAELAELENREWTEAEIISALSMALEARAMEAVADLLHRLARVAPRKAQLILDFIALTEAVGAAARPEESA